MQSTVKSQINLDVDGSGKKWLLKKTSGWCIDQSHQVYLCLCVLVRLLLKQRIHAKSVFIAQAIGVGKQQNLQQQKVCWKEVPFNTKVTWYISFQTSGTIWSNHARTYVWHLKNISIGLTSSQLLRDLLAQRTQHLRTCIIHFQLPALQRTCRTLSTKAIH